MKQATPAPRHPHISGVFIHLLFTSNSTNYFPATSHPIGVTQTAETALSPAGITHIFSAACCNTADKTIKNVSLQCMKNLCKANGVIRGKTSDSSKGKCRSQQDCLQANFSRGRRKRFIHSWDKKKKLKK